MRIDIMTLFPDAIEAMMGQSIIGRARDRGYIELFTHQIREYTTNKQMQVDDYPYGGGREYLIPAVRDVFIAAVDADGEVIRVHMMKGLATDED